MIDKILERIIRFFIELFKKEEIEEKQQVDTIKEDIEYATARSIMSVNVYTTPEIRELIGLRRKEIEDEVRIPLVSGSFINVNNCSIVSGTILCNLDRPITRPLR